MSTVANRKVMIVEDSGRSFLARMLAKLKLATIGHGTTLSPEAKEEKISLRKQGLAGCSRAPLRKNGTREMTRRVRQRARGTHGL